MQETVSDEARGDQWGVRAAYVKERFVILKEERVGGRARVTIDVVKGWCLQGTP